MVFYYFGPDPSSWAFGNDRNNLPQDLRIVWEQLGEPFQDKQLAGTRIQWISTAPDGRYAIMTKNGEFLSNCDDLVKTVIQQLRTVYGTCVRHVSFSPLGGWFVGYTDGTVQLSGRFPDAFYTLSSQHLLLTGLAAQSRQLSIIQDVFFGSYQSLVVKTNTGLLWDGITDALAQTLTSLTDMRTTGILFALGPNTALCPWSDEYYFIEAVSGYGSAQFPFVLPTGLVTQELLVQMTQNIKPPDSLIPSATITAPPGPTQPSPKPSPMDNKPSPTSRPSNIPASLSPPSVPDNMRRRYEQQFDQHSGGKSHLTGAKAAHILLSSGLERRTLSEIWELTDQDKNGQLDREEFVQAMWQMDTRLTGEKTKIRWADSAITCNGCASGLNIGEEILFCYICNGGDFDLCQSCHTDPSKLCQHTLCQVTIQISNNITFRDILGEYAFCNGCTAVLTDQTVVYFCQTCNDGDYDVCEACWKARKTCGHALVLKKIKAFSDPYEATPSAAEESSQTLTSLSRHTQSSSPLDWSTANTAPSTDSGNQKPLGEPSAMDKLSKKFMDSTLKDSLLSSIVSEKPNVKWEDVAGLEAAKAELQEAIIFPLRFPQMFRGKRQARRALLLYGPPGTGKSYLAKAVATEMDHTLFSISSGDVMSKWMGESEGLMRQLFVLAREKKPSIIFIDELDALCGKRDGNNANAEDTARMKTEFLVQMDGLGNNNDGVFVLAATNLPWVLDPAVRRRFQKRIHVPLPDEAARSELFKVQLGDMGSSLGSTELAFLDLARRTAGFSGSDIANLVQDALMMPIRKVHTATHFRKFRDRDGEWFTPCNPSDSGAVSMRWNRVPAKQLKEPPLSFEDLFAAVGKTKRSVGEEEVQKCSEWTQQYGMEGA